MRRLLVVVAPVVALVGCKGKALEWKPQVLTKVDLAPYSFDIPSGWRDLSESALPELAHITRPLGPDAHMLVREKATNTDTNIAFMAADSGPGFNCDTLVDALSTQAQQQVDRKSLATETFGSDTGCSFKFKDDGAVGQSWVRLKSSKFYMLQCVHSSDGDADADATCTRLAAAFKAQ